MNDPHSDALVDAVKHLVASQVAAQVEERVNEVLAPYRPALERLAALSQALGPVTVVATPSTVASGLTKRPAAPAPASADVTVCAVKGCGREPSAKGYCMNHYQKRLRLIARKALPAEWKEYAAPGSVDDVTLPRGPVGRRGPRARRPARAE